MYRGGFQSLCVFRGDSRMLNPSRLFHDVPLMAIREVFLIGHMCSTINKNPETVSVIQPEDQKSKATKYRFLPLPQTIHNPKFSLGPHKIISVLSQQEVA